MIFPVAYYRDSLLMNLIALLVAILVDQMRAAGEGGCSDLCGGEAPNWLVGAASFVRGRGGKAGQLLLGDQDIEQQADDSSDVVINQIISIIFFCNFVKLNGCFVFILTFYTRVCNVRNSEAPQVA